MESCMKMDLCSELLCHVVWQKYTNVSEVLAASNIRMMITLMMDAASTYATSLNFYQTTYHNNSEDSHIWHKTNPYPSVYFLILNSYIGSSEGSSGSIRFTRYCTEHVCNGFWIQTSLLLWGGGGQVLVDSNGSIVAVVCKCRLPTLNDQESTICPSHVLLYNYM
jgi:hypothetical protein